MSRRKAIDVEATLREREKLLSDGEQNLAALERALAEKQSRLEILCQLNEEGEGLAEGSQAVMKGIGDFSRFREAVTGSLVAQLDVDSKFIPAIEAALGRNLHALVLKDADAACEIIAQPKKQQLGQAALVIPQSTGTAPHSNRKDLATGTVVMVNDNI